MSADFLTITMRGEETLANDLNDEVLAISNISHDALYRVGSDMIMSLQYHIREDWYEPWGPPKAYERRTNTGDPDALGSEKNMHPDVNGLSLSFVYAPTGRHTVREWNSRSGDALIETIQTDSGWTWEPDKDKRGREIMPRPFWNNFGEEMRNGEAFDSFERGFAGHGYDLIREAGQKDMEFPANEGMLEASFAEADYDLPL